MSSPVIRAPSISDRAEWEVLWQGYLEFYGVNLPSHITNATWDRLLDDKVPMFCLVAENGGGGLAGFTHCVVHLNTWTDRPVCYLEDLFIAPECRNTGTGRRLIEAVAQKAKKMSWGRLYWMTQEDNDTARSLYDKVGKFSGFIRYDYPLTPK